jgi:hypothetical protein
LKCVTGAATGDALLAFMAAAPPYVILDPTKAAATIDSDREE